jgi:hypothetical protein
MICGVPSFSYDEATPSVHTKRKEINANARKYQKY